MMKKFQVSSALGTQMVKSLQTMLYFVLPLHVNFYLINFLWPEAALEVHCLSHSLWPADLHRPLNQILCKKPKNHLLLQECGHVAETWPALVALWTGYHTDACGWHWVRHCLCSAQAGSLPVHRLPRKHRFTWILASPVLQVNKVL